MSSQEERKALYKKQAVWKAELILKQENIKELSYQDCVLLLKDTIKILRSLCPTDIAWKNFHALVTTYRNLCQAHSIIHWSKGLGFLTDHMVKYDVIWTYDKGNVFEETELYIPLGKREREVDLELRIAGTARLAMEGIHHSKTLDLEVVIT